MPILSNLAVVDLASSEFGEADADLVEGYYNLRARENRRSSTHPGCRQRDPHNTLFFLQAREDRRISEVDFGGSGRGKHCVGNFEVWYFLRRTFPPCGQ